MSKPEESNGYSAMPGPSGAGEAVSVCTATIKLPEFWQRNPRPWFQHIEAQFQLVPSDFSILEDWLLQNKLLLNKNKSVVMIFGTNSKLKSISDSCKISCKDGTTLQKVDKMKYLGVWLDPTLSFKTHIDYMIRKVNCRINMLYRSRNCFTFSVRKKLAMQLIFPILDYCDVVYISAPKSVLVPLIKVYNRTCRFILECPYLTHHCLMYQSLQFPSPHARRQLHWFQFIFKCIHFNYPPLILNSIFCNLPLLIKPDTLFTPTFPFHIPEKQPVEKHLCSEHQMTGITYPCVSDLLHLLIALIMPCLHILKLLVLSTLQVLLYLFLYLGLFLYLLLLLFLYLGLFLYLLLLLFLYLGLFLYLLLLLFLYLGLLLYLHLLFELPLSFFFFFFFLVTCRYSDMPLLRH
ncbi:hypothetical protein N1851_012350 [Merluccius polli]|uniref:Uncharacterized protein n=1 Tax=Merluccius polli TaxID=89951 RepID=A0AA47MWH1_MERPO|nr:hypothetical protein N1851_012350 [Merluccius polli]